METVKAKHTVGDEIHVKLFLHDDRASLNFYGRITGSRLHKGTHFSDRILYSVEVDQSDAPPIEITNLPTGFIGVGGPKIEEAQAD